MNWPVIVWILASVGGAILSAKLSNESRRDLDALARRGIANGRRAAARSRRLRETIRLTVHLAYILAGVLVLRVIPLPEGWTPATIVVPILIYGNLAMVANSLIDLRTRPLLWETRGDEAPIRLAKATERQADATERLATAVEANGDLPPPE